MHATTSTSRWCAQASPPAGVARRRGAPRVPTALLTAAPSPAAPTGDLEGVAKAR